MNADRLLAYYERFTEAPDAIARLRLFILDLAVRGKLVPQDASDEPARELLKRIAKEKARLVKAGELRKLKSLPHFSDRELAFAVAIGWSIAALDDLSPRSVSDGDWIETKDQSVDGGVRLVQLADVGVGEFLNKSSRYITEETERRLNCTRLSTGDILIARLPNPIGRACILPELGQPAITAVDVAILKMDTNIFTHFLVLAMNAPPIREQIEAYGKGATRFRVSTGHLKTVQIPVPPLAEQHRIVAKVDELMGLCDRLEAARSSREAVRDRLTEASLARLNAPDPNTFKSDVRFAIDVLPALTSRPDQIKALRQTILNLAVRGKLVPQHATDEPASELLKRIARAKFERKKRTGDARIRTATDPTPNQLDIQLPLGWAIQSFENLFLFIDYRGNTPPKKGSGVPLITAKNVRVGYLNREPREYISEATFKSWMVRGFPEIEDLFFTTEAPLANVCLNDIDEPFALAQRVICFQPYMKINTKFLMFALMSDVMQSLIDKHATGMTAKGIKAANLKPLPIPIPPLAEQQRIVAKVDKLMALCDRLKASLADAATGRSRLLDAVLAEALMPVGGVAQRSGAP